MKNLVLAAALLTCLPALARPRAARASCPPPTVARGAVCTLLRDERIATPLIVPSGTHVSCGGRRLLPKEGAQLAVLIHDATDVKLTACRIEGFDFGVFVLRGQRALVAGNLIEARVKGVTLYGSEHVTIGANVIRYASGQGYGVGLWRGSHENAVLLNLIEGAVAPASDAHPDFPGPDINWYALSPGAVFGGSAVIVGNGSLSLNQFLVGDLIFQFASDPRGVEKNVVENNLIVVGSAAAPAGVQISNRAVGTVVRGNFVRAVGTATANGITAGPGSNGLVRLPSTCTLLPSRLCHRDADCDLLGAAPGENGVCAGPPGCGTGSGLCGDRVPRDLRSRDLVVEDNVLAPGFAIGVKDTGSLTSRIAGNRVTGATLAAVWLEGPAVAGATVGTEELEGATVEHNVLAASRVGLSLGAPGSKLVFQNNDVLGSTTRPLAAVAGWTVDLDLDGNHWDRGCADAFRPLPAGPLVCTGPVASPCDEDADCPDSLCGTEEAEAPNAYILDGAPSCVPVAGTE